jgi:periplasmic protein TonB
VSREVDRILATRARSAGHRPEAASLGAALLLHGLVAAVVLLLSHYKPPPPPLEFVPVQIIPAQALGVRRPAPPRPRRPEPAAEEQKAAEPEPPAAEPETEKPEVKPPEPAREEAPVLPDETKKDKKETKKPEPPRPESPRTGKAETGKKPETGKPSSEPPGQGKAGSEGPAGVTPGETGDQLGRRGGADGSPLGTTAFGSRIGVDNPDFTYGYYLDRLLSLIDANWTRPALGSGVRAVLSFRIERDGTLSELKVAESSGYNSFDLAALRAVQNASPFPPLPRAYRSDSLGVNLIVY